MPASIKPQKRHADALRRIAATGAAFEAHASCLRQAHNRKNLLRDLHNFGFVANGKWRLVVTDAGREYLYRCDVKRGRCAPRGRNRNAVPRAFARAAPVVVAEHGCDAARALAARFGVAANTAHNYVWKLRALGLLPKKTAGR